MDPVLAFEKGEIARRKAIDDVTARGNSPVQQFYAGAVLFITGASGFLGKQLIEKLLRSCNIKKIYILLRPKKKKTFDERVKDLLNDPVYEVLKQIKPNFIDKIIPIQGDVSEVGLGMREEDRQIIREEVTIIFHGAATINFVESLKTSTFTNIRGTCEMMNLARGCKKLKSYVHISTAYSHATYLREGQDVLERFYDSPVPPGAMIRLAEQLSEEKLNAITEKLITNWPNTYSFTKAIAEEAVRTMAGDLPICIVRPAIVITALREPLPGWIDVSCAFGPSGLVIGTGLGVLQIVKADRRIVLDLVPVDLVNNAVISAAHATAARRARGEAGIKIYTVTGTRNPLVFGRLVETMDNIGREMATDKAVLYTFGVITKNSTIYYVAAWVLHYIPGYIVDTCLRIMGHTPILIKVYNKMIKLNTVLSYFMTKDWKFGDHNLKELYWNLSPADRIIFDSNMAGIDWEHYIMIWIMGTRKYIVKDGLKYTEYGIKKQHFLKFAYVVLMPLYLYTLYKIAYFFLYLVFVLITSLCNFF